MSNPEVPDYLKSGPMYEAAQKSLQDAAAMAAASNSVPRISLRGREFRLVENGEEVAKFRDAINVVILGVEPEPGKMIKTFYKDGYKSGAKEPPTCSSEDGIAPAPWVTQKQAVTCAQCPKNVFGSATSPNGKATKACRDSKRAWLVMADDPKPIPERTLYGLNVTVASLKSFSEHGRRLLGLGQSPFVAVTKITMLDMEFPQLEFDLGGWVKQDDLPHTLKISQERPWRIKYASAGLALAMGGESARPSVPTTLPGQEVVDAAPAATKPLPPASAIDDAIKGW